MYLRSHLSDCLLCFAFEQIIISIILFQGHKPCICWATLVRLLVNYRGYSCFLLLPFDFSRLPVLNAWRNQFSLKPMLRRLSLLKLCSAPLKPMYHLWLCVHINFVCLKQSQNNKKSSFKRSLILIIVFFHLVTCNTGKHGINCDKALELLYRAGHLQEWQGTVSCSAAIIWSLSISFCQAASSNAADVTLANN